MEIYTTYSRVTDLEFRMKKKEKTVTLVYDKMCTKLWEKKSYFCIYKEEDFLKTLWFSGK